jgi:hypothetical protein
MHAQPTPTISGHDWPCLANALQAFKSQPKKYFYSRRERLTSLLCLSNFKCFLEILTVSMAFLEKDEI